MGLKSTLHNLKEKYKGQKMAPAFNALHTFLYLPNEVPMVELILKQQMI